MTKIIALIAALSLFASVLPAMAAPKGRTGEKPLFQMVSDTIEKPDPTQKKEHKVEVFRNTSNNISKWQESSLKAKPLSLRGNKKELCERMRIPKR